MYLCKCVRSVFTFLHNIQDLQIDQKDIDIVSMIILSFYSLFKKTVLVETTTTAVVVLFQAAIGNFEAVWRKIFGRQDSTQLRLHQLRAGWVVISPRSKAMQIAHNLRPGH